MDEYIHILGFGFHTQTRSIYNACRFSCMRIYPNAFPLSPEDLDAQDQLKLGFLLVRSTNLFY